MSVESHALSQPVTRQVSKDKEPKRFWVTDEYYFLVTPEGYTLEKETFEGSLGYVIKLHYKNNQSDNEEMPNIYAALKIPKLTGATHRENAYIIDLMEQEEIGAFTAYSRGKPEGLLGFYTPRNIFRRITVIENKEATEFSQGGVVLVNCAPGRLPRFCLVRNGSFYPESVTSAIDKFETLYEELKDIENKYLSIFMFNMRTSDQKVTLNQIDAKTTDPIGDTWYAFLPNTVYRWADGTFQEAVSLNSRGKWNIDQQIIFMQQICSGIKTLHRNRFIHADVRPANIVFVGDPTDPNNYLLADYGSFATMYASAPIIDIRNGQPGFGTVLQGEHTSVFYAPERAQGQERETANKALIIKHSNERLYVALGWKQDKDMVTTVQNYIKSLGKKGVDNDTDLDLYDETLSGTENAEETYSSTVMKALYKSPSNTSDSYASSYASDRELRTDDLVRIQDYVFRLAESEEVTNNVRILPCLTKEVKRIYQRHIATKIEISELPDELSVDRVVEIKQWSAATDIYSLGVVLLYSLFRNIERNNQQQSANFREKANYENLVEDRFQNMLSVLISPSYFRIIWPAIEEICNKIKNHLEMEEASDIAGIEVEIELGEKKGSKKVTLKQRCIEVINRIAVTVPGARDLVEVLDLHMPAFLFFMRFALACLHRRSHLGNLTEEYAFLSKEMPFCKDRIENPYNPEGKSSAILASEELEWIEKHIRARRLKDLILTNEEYQKIDIYDVRPNATVREYLMFANQDIRQASEKLDSFWRNPFKMPDLFEARNRLKEARDRAETYSKTVEEQL